MEYERPNLFFRFEDLRIYNKALDYVSWAYSNTQEFPETEIQGLAAKFINSAENIAISIAEGSGRNKIQFIFYLKQAKSFIRESVVRSAICHRLGYFTDEALEESKTYLIEMTRMVGALIASLQRSEREHEKVEEEIDFNQMPPFPEI